jgi:hypothetical protein
MMQNEIEIGRTTYLFFLDGIVDFPCEALTKVGSNMAQRCRRLLAEMTHGRSIPIKFVAFKQRDFLVCIVRVALVIFGQ